MRSARSILVLAALAAACRNGGNAAAMIDADHDGVAAALDCDDSDPTAHATVTAYADTDGDHVGAGPAFSFCTAGGAPAGYVLDGTDCAADDPTAWRKVTNPPVDRDGDGFTAPTTVTLCIGDTLPEPYRAVARGNDCDDQDRPDLYRWVIAYRDHDGDGVGARPRSILCAGDTLPAGFTTTGFDVNDLDSSVTTDPADDDLARILD